jgi:hypothetical protein
MLAFGAFVAVLERIRDPPATPVITFTGLAGVYLGLCATVAHVGWLYLPCLVLLLSVAAAQLRAFRRSGRDDDNRRTAGTVYRDPGRPVDPRQIRAFTPQRDDA